MANPTFLASLWRGSANGFFVSGLIYCLEMLAQDPPVSHWLRRVPFLLMFALRSGAYLGCILLGFALSDEVTSSPFPGFNSFDKGIVTTSLIFAIGFNLVLAVDRLLGRGVLVNVLLGRYAQPQREERLIAMVDLVGSSKAASELGDLGFFRYLNQVFVEVEDAMTANGAEIHKYLGDGIIVAWNTQRGLSGGAAIHDCLAAISALEAKKARFLEQFGRAPRIRVALHVGPVVAGELGEYRREIALIGDTLNATAQIEAATKGLEPGLFVSDIALSQFGSLPGMRTVPLEPAELKGHAQPIGIRRVEAA